MSIRICARCNRERRICARGLCPACYQYACDKRPLDQYDPRRDRDDAATLEDLAFLAEHGVGATEAATRTGFNTRGAMEHFLRRNGHQALLTRLLDRDPRDPNLDTGRNGHGLTKAAYARRKRVAA